MEAKLTTLEIQDIASRLNIDTPVMSYRVVGDRVELRLLGGATAVYSPAENELLLERLARLKVPELRGLAGHLNIPGRGRMTRAQLYAAITAAGASSITIALDRLAEKKFTKTCTGKNNEE